MNGRVDALHGSPDPFALYSQSSDHRGADNMAATIRMQPNALSDLYFGRTNVEALQQGMRYGVYKSTGRIIGRQSDVELGVVMRSIYLQDSRNDARPPKDQVRELNASVLAFCVPRIVEEVRMYEQYRRDASSLPIPLDRGELATSKGTRTLEMKPFF
jgi:hypothetical protein